MLDQEQVLNVTNDLHKQLAATANACKEIGSSGGSPIHHLMLNNQHTIMRADHLIVAMLTDLNFVVAGMGQATKTLAEAIPGITKLSN